MNAHVMLWLGIVAIFGIVALFMPKPRLRDGVEPDRGQLDRILDAPFEDPNKRFD